MSIHPGYSNIVGLASQQEGLSVYMLEVQKFGLNFNYIARFLANTL